MLNCNKSHGAIPCDDEVKMRLEDEASERLSERGKVV